MIEITVQNLTDTSATLLITDSGVPASVSVRVTTTGEDPRDKTSDANGLVSFTGLTPATTYSVKAGPTAAPVISQFTTKATGYNDPKIATKEQWEDLATKIGHIETVLQTLNTGSGV